MSAADKKDALIYLTILHPPNPLPEGGWVGKHSLWITNGAGVGIYNKKNNICISYLPHPLYPPLFTLKERGNYFWRDYVPPKPPFNYTSGFSLFTHYP
jgi:hypothetical protein